MLDPESKNHFSVEEYRERVRRTAEAVREAGFDFLCARLEEPGLRDLVISKAASGEFDLNQEAVVRDGVRRVRQRQLRRKIDELGTELRRTEREKPDPARMRELLAEKMHLDSELAKMNTRAAGV